MESPFEKHVFVCTGGSVCTSDGSPAVYSRLKERVKEAGMAAKVRINKAGCMAQCGHGPMVVVYPENVWYGRISVGDADEIFRNHLVEGRPVERLVYRPARPGSNKISDGSLSAGEAGSN